MKRNIILLCFTLFSIAKIFAQTTPCKEVIGYYGSWQWYDRGKLVTPESINYSKYTIINYAFFKPKKDGTIGINDPWADKNLLLGPINWSNPLQQPPAGYENSFDLGNPVYHYPKKKFSDYCHAKGVKFLASIGGWTLSDSLPTIAASAALRSTFAQSCVNLIQLYGFDGIDLDWEYPGFAEHNGTPQDKGNFTLLLQDIRAALTTYGNTVNKTFMFTIAVGAAEDKMQHVEWSAIHPLVDIINVMSYDFFGAFDNSTNHNSPLFAPIAGDQKFNCAQAIEKLVDDYHVPANKLTMGLAFYGRSTKTQGAAGLHVPATGGSDQVTFLIDEGVPTYYNILKNKSLFDEFWDPAANVPYLLGKGNLQTFVSYDDERSIGLKAKYIVDHSLKGAIIWEMSGDYIQSASNPNQIVGTPLADTLNKVFCNYLGGGKNTPYITWKNPATIAYGTALSATQLNALANVPGTFSYSPALSTVLPAGTHTLTVTFTPTKPAYYTTVNATVQIIVTKLDPVITWSAPASINSATPLTGTQLNATANVAGTFVYTPAIGTVIAVGTHTLSVSFTPTDAVNYNNATATVSIIVTQAPITPVITWATPASIVYGTALSATQLNASTPVSGTFTYSPALGAILSVGTQTLTVTFTPTDATLYTTASASVQLVVTKATPVLTWATPTTITYGTALSSVQLNASTPVQGTYVYTPANGTMLSVGTHTLNVLFTPTDQTNYTTATGSVQITVVKGTPVLVWNNPADIVFGTPLSSTQLNASCVVPGTYSYLPGDGTVLSAGTRTLTVVFTPTDVLNYNSASASVQLNVNRLTPTIVWNNPAAIGQGTALSGTQLNASCTIAGTFSYNPSLGTLLPVGTQMLTVTFTPTNTTDYTVVSKTVQIVVYNTNGITELSTDKIQIYPNPTADVLNMTAHLHQVEIVNVYGQIVISQVPETNLIEVGHLSEGIYYLRSDEGLFKFVIKH